MPTLKMQSKESGGVGYELPGQNFYRTCKRGGKPCICGIRITVYDVLEYLASGMSEQELIDDFPDLTQEDIRACLAFAANRERKLISAIDS
jgi:uncharacterized protein (DUF433 family)